MTRHPRRFGPRLLATLAVVAILAAAIGAGAIAAPTPSTTPASSRAQTVDWLAADLVDKLATADITVFAPTYIPDPFASQPSVDAGPGYYSLYWVVPGAPPTYLRFSGEAGGAVPEFSYYDRRTQLQQNATVLGVPAWHDLTPIYDIVYFVIDDVLYTIESRNLSVDTSLSLADNLVALPADDAPAFTPTPVQNDGTDIAVPTPTINPLAIYDSGNSAATIAAPATVGSGKIVTITVDNITSADLVSDSGQWLESGDEVYAYVGPGVYEWKAPPAETPASVMISIIEPATGEVITSTTVTIIPPRPEDVPVMIETLACPERMPSGSMITLRGYGSGQLRFRTTDGIFPAAGANWHFAGESAGLDAMDGVVLVERDFDIWLQPNPAIDVEYTTYIFVETWGGASLAECGIVIVPATPASFPAMGTTDGTGGVAGVGYASLEAGDGSNVPTAFFGDGSGIALVERPIAGQTDTGDFLAIPAGRRDPDDDATAATPIAATPTPSALPGAASATPTP